MMMISCCHQWQRFPDTGDIDGHVDVDIDENSDDDDDDDDDDDGVDVRGDDGDGVDDRDDDGDDGHMVTMLLCLPAAGETPRNWIWKKEAGIACSGMFCNDK